MTRTARHRGPLHPRWVRGLLAGALFASLSAGIGGCGIPYVYRNISPLHPTGWSFAWPILPSQQQRLEEDITRGGADRVPILDPVPGEFAPPPCLDPPSEAEIWAKVPKFRHGSRPVLHGPAEQRPVRDREDRRGGRPLQGRTRWPAPASWSTATTSARSTSTSSTGRTTRSRSTPATPASRSSTSTRTTSAAAAARRWPPSPAAADRPPADRPRAAPAPRPDRRPCPGGRGRSTAASDPATPPGARPTWWRPDSGGPSSPDIRGGSPEIGSSAPTFCEYAADPLRY